LPTRSLDLGGVRIALRLDAPPTVSQPAFGGLDIITGAVRLNLTAGAYRQAGDVTIFLGSKAHGMPPVEYSREAVTATLSRDTPVFQHDFALPLPFAINESDLWAVVAEFRGGSLVSLQVPHTFTLLPPAPVRGLLVALAEVLPPMQRTDQFRTEEGFVQYEFVPQDPQTAPFERLTLTVTLLRVPPRGDALEGRITLTRPRPRLLASLLSLFVTVQQEIVLPFNFKATELLPSADATGGNPYAPPLHAPSPAVLAQLRSLFTAYLPERKAVHEPSEPGKVSRKSDPMER
jgi:hypothetical protein